MARIKVVAFVFAMAARALAQCPPALATELTAADNALGDYFGQDAAVSGDVAIVIALSHAGGGKAYVYGRDPWDAHHWTQTAEFAAAPGTIYTRVEVQGQIAAVNQYNRVEVHERDAGGAGSWGQVALLESAYFPANIDEYGRALAIDGDTLVVGAGGRLFGIQGSAYVYRRDAGGPGNWGLVKHLFSPDQGNGAKVFGQAVALEGDRLVVGDPGKYPNGVCYVFERDLGGPEQWGLVTTVPSNMPYLGSPNMAGFGAALALSGDLLLVGAPFTNNAHMHRRNAGGADNWGLVDRFHAQGTPYAHFGTSVALAAGRALIGAPWESSVAAYAGCVYVFEPLGSGDSVWLETARLDLPNATPYDYLGERLSVSSTTVVASNGRNSVNGSPGLVAVFDLASPPTPSAYCTSGTSSAGCTGVLVGVGTPSASLDQGFDLVAIDLDGARSAAILYGTSPSSGIAIPGSQSWRCLAAPHARLSTATASGSAGSCDGEMRVDWNAYRAAHPGGLGAPFAAGQTFVAQGWWRDPGSAAGSATTQGLSFQLCP